MNVGALKSNGDAWAARARAEQSVLELIAGSPSMASIDKTVTPLPFSPDLHIGDLPELIADGAIHPRPVTSPAEQALVDAALSPQPALTP
jgi:hypothetical protein